MLKEIPLLTPKDVELRVQQINKTQHGFYATLLVYKEARTDMNILDEVFGAMNWQRKHKIASDGTMCCSILVWDEEKNHWVEKEDAGQESYSEAVKGKASDSFKRAGVNWGIGRELYNAPNIFFKLDDSEVKVTGDGKYKTYSHFNVREMAYDKNKRAFTVFDVVDKEGRVRFSLDKNSVTSTNSTTTQPKVVDQSSTGTICTGCGELISSEKVIRFSTSKYGSPLCMNCQDNARRSAA